MGRLMCLDVGDRRIGVAFSDPGRLIATPHSYIESRGWGPDKAKVKALFDQMEADYIVCGLPLNMDGSAGFQAEKVKNFVRQLEGLGLRVEFMDERLSTVEATDALIEADMSRERRKTNVDKVAAAIILQRYLDKIERG